MLRYILIIILGTMSFFGRAEHLIGGDLAYECLGDGRYVITLRLYRDCRPGPGANFDNQMAIGVYNAIDNTIAETLFIARDPTIDTFGIDPQIPCLIDTPNVCISGALYRDTFELDVPIGGLHVVAQRCCRPPDAINIVNPDDFGSTYYAFVPDSTVAKCNSSPVFAEPPPVILCSEIYMDLNYSCVDKDSDSLVYYFCKPYHGGGIQFNPPNGPNSPVPIPPTPPPYQTLTWDVGFNTLNQITSLPAFEVDSATGIITGRPTQTGTHIVAVCVQEWRDTILIGEYKRDFELTTTSCELDAAAAIDSALEECIGFEIQFFNLSTLGSNFFWDFGDPSATDDTSRSTNPSYTYPDTGTYEITLISFGQVCTDTSVMEYRVQHKIEPEFSPPEPDCLDGHKYYFLPEGFYRTTTKMYWDLEDTIITTNKPDLIGPIRFDSTGYHYITLTYDDLGCLKSYTDSVKVWPNPGVRIVELADTQCSPFRAEYSIDTTFAYKPTYYWHVDSIPIPGDEQAVVMEDIPGVYGMSIRMITDSLCIDTVEVYYPAHVNVLDTPSAKFDFRDRIAGMYEPNFSMYDESVKAQEVIYLLNDELLTTRPDYDFSLEDTGWFEVKQYAIHENGCVDSANRLIRVEPEYLFFAPNAFSPNGDGDNETWSASVFVHESYDLKIFNRWGEVIFKTNDPTYAWDGTEWNGGRKECPMGSYTFKAEVVDNIGRQWFYAGTILLYR